MGLCMLLEFIGGIVILVYGVEESDTLTDDLKEVFFKLIYRMDHDERANRILKIIQEYVSTKKYLLSGCILCVNTHNCMGLTLGRCYSFKIVHT